MRSEPFPAVCSNFSRSLLQPAHVGITAIVNRAPYFCEEINSALETQLCGRVNRSLPASQPSFSTGMRGAGL